MPYYYTFIRSKPYYTYNRHCRSFTGSFGKQCRSHLVSLIKAEGLFAPYIVSNFDIVNSGTSVQRYIYIWSQVCMFIHTWWHLCNNSINSSHRRPPSTPHIRSCQCTHTGRAHRGASTPRIPEQGVPPQHRPRPRHSYQHHHAKGPGTHSHFHALEWSWTRHAGGRVIPQPHSRDQRRVLILTRISSNRWPQWLSGFRYENSIFTA